MTRDEGGRLTYRSSGVDAARADALVERIAGFAKSTARPGLVQGIGGFAALFSLKEALAALAGAGSIADPLLVSGTDGVGTKLKIAFLADRHDTVGIDLVAMCVNDVLTTGAIPLFFLDYFATGRLELGTAEAVIRGIAEGCRIAECALVGGETAEMPGIYGEGEYDLAGFAVGVVDRARVIDGTRVRPKDRLIGIRSRGLHSNGYSLVRRALLERAGYTLTSIPPGLGRPLVDELLEPTAIYTRCVRALVERARPKALAHITGAGIAGNLPRVLPAGVRAVIDRSTWSPQAIFGVVKEAGEVEEREMFETFNMGIGLIAVVAPEDESAAMEAVKDGGEAAAVIGEIREGEEADEAFVEVVGGE